MPGPAAGFGETEFYPEFVRKAAVLIVRLAKNHPLPDGNKRVDDFVAAWDKVMTSIASTWLDRRDWGATRCATCGRA